MARRTNTKDTAPADDFDDLLASEDAAPETPAVEDLVSELPEEEEPEEVAAAPVTMTPAQKRLADARAARARLEEEARQLAAQQDVPAQDERDEYEGLTEEEIAELKAIEDGNARLAASRIENASVQYDNSQRGGTGEKILIHVVRDGFTVFGDVWLRGQEMEIEVGTPAYERTKDVNGNSWLDLRNDKAGQYARWGREYIAEGPFIPYPGEKFDDEVARADRRRNRSVPVLAI